MLGMPAEISERGDKQADNSQTDLVVFLALKKAQSGVVVQAKLQVLVEHGSSLQSLLHAGGFGVEVDSTLNYDCAGDKLGGKEGKPVHEDAGRT
jgi:hypothetical protein